MTRLLFFADLREKLGVGEEQVDLPDTITDVAGLTEWLQGRSDVWKEALTDKRLRVAVNQAIVSPDAPVHDGDEVAWFPPVTGG